MIKYIVGKGYQAHPPIGSNEQLELCKLGMDTCGFLLNTPEYCNKWVSWNTFGQLIADHSAHPKATAISKAMQSVVTRCSVENSLEECL